MKEVREGTSTGEKQGEEQVQKPWSGNVPVGSRTSGKAGSPCDCSRGSRGRRAGIGVQALWQGATWLASSRTSAFSLRWEASEMGAFLFVCFFFNQIFISQNFSYLHLSQEAFLFLAQETLAIKPCPWVHPSLQCSLLLPPPSTFILPFEGFEHRSDDILKESLYYATEPSQPRYGTGVTTLG